MTQHSFSVAPAGHNLSEPVLAVLLEKRTTGLIIVGAAVVHTVLVMLGLPSWQCPIRTTLGVPCPGCGLSRATDALLQGDWRTSLTYHAFAPLFLAAFLLIAVVTVLPVAKNRLVVEWIGWAERRTKISAVLLILFMVYWLIRLLFFREAFFNLIMG